MADVASALYSWSTTASSNSPSGATNVGSGLDDNLRQLQATVREGLAHYNSTPVASAGTVDLGAQTGNFLIISGTTTITAFGTVSAGIWKVVRFSGALTLTYNGASLILPGAANITTVAGDVAGFVSEGSGNWRCFFYEPIDGRTVVSTVLDSEFQILDNSDPTKIAQFQASGITAGQTRTYTLPDASTTVVGHDATQTLSNKTLTAPTINTSVAGTAVAGQSDMETPTSSAIIVTPAVVKNHPGVAKAWALITWSAGTPTLTTGHNIASLTDNGTGDVTITFTTAFSSADYVVVRSMTSSSGGSSAAYDPIIVSRAAGTVRIKCGLPAASDNTAFTAFDSHELSVACFGDFA
jgi:hypothetical protein